MRNRRQWLLTAAFAVALVWTGLFAVRASRHVRPLRAAADEPIRPWMSIPYVAHSYHVPPQVLFQALDLPFNPRDRRPIGKIARAQGRSIQDVEALLRQAIIHARPPYPPPPPPPPLPPPPPGQSGVEQPGSSRSAQ